MRKYQNFALLLCSLLIGLHSFAQQPLNQINILSFSVKNKMPADVASWGTIPGGMILTAQRIPQTSIQGIRLVVQIKQAGAKICGNPIDASPLLDFNAVKTFTAAELNGYISNCNSLKPGNYSICVQFFNVDRYPISKEVCKEFVVEDVVQAQQNYSPPQNISPVNEKQFNEAEVKGSVTFRWTPVLPKPKEQVTYRLKVWQLMQGQNSTAAIKSNIPVIEKDITNLTQAVVTNLYNGPCKPPYLCEYVWNVQALDTKGMPIGGNGGMSESTAFSIIVVDPSVGCFKLDTTMLKVECNGYDQNGKPIYKITNLILQNIGTNNGRTGLHNLPATNYITPTGFTVANLTPLSANPILPSGSVNISFDLYGTTGTTATFVVNSTIVDPTNPNLYCDKTIGVTVDLPLCICNDCKDLQYTVSSPSVTLSNPINGIYNAIGSLNITGIPTIYGIEMQVQSYSFTATPAACSNGVTSVETSGVFVGASSTINGIPVAMLNESVSGLTSSNNGVAKNIKVTSSTPMPGSIPFNINFGLPTSLAGLNANCCKMNYTFCITVKVFYDKDKCNSCSIKYCFPAFTN